MRLENKVAVITGGSGGIGSAAVRLFVENGANVLAVDRDEDRLQEAIAGLNPEKAAYCCADVSQEADVNAYMRAAVERFGGVDITLLNAGVLGELLPITEYPVEMFDAVTSVNMRGAWLGLRAAFGHMKGRGGGSIVMTSSVQGLSAIQYTTAYTASKHAVVGMMRGAALEGAQFKIRVNTVHPGLTNTQMMGGLHEQLASEAETEQTAQGIMDDWAQTVPMRRYAAPVELARLMLFLASDDASYCTGQTYVADGGLLTSWTPTVTEDVMQGHNSSGPRV